MKNRYIQTLLISISIITYTTNAHSQTWCPAGATWYYTDVSADVDGYSKLTYSNDTIINTITCKKITLYYKGNGWQGLYNGYGKPFYTYEQNGVAYLYNNKYGNNKFDTLFNINAQAGDKWRMPLVDTACADTLFFMKVLDKGVKNLNGFNLRWLYVKTGPLYYNGYTYSFDTITERLGFRYDDIDYFICHGAVAEVAHGRLRCYSDNAFGFYSTGISTSCDYYYTGIKESKIKGKILNIFPNPTNDKLNINIHLEQGQNATIEVYDVAGKLVLSNVVEIANGLTEISVASVSPGMYFYKINVNNAMVNSGKLSIIR